MSRPVDVIRYPAILTQDGKFILVTFPDIPEAITQGDNVAHALEMAAEALETALDFYLEDRRAVPAPSPLKVGQHFVELPAAMATRVRSLNG